MRGHGVSPVFGTLCSAPRGTGQRRSARRTAGLRYRHRRLAHPPRIPCEKRNAARTGQRRRTSAACPRPEGSGSGRDPQGGPLPVRKRVIEVCEKPYIREKITHIRGKNREKRDTWTSTPQETTTEIMPGASLVPGPIPLQVRRIAPAGAAPSTPLAQIAHRPRPALKALHSESRQAPGRRL